MHNLPIASCSLLLSPVGHLVPSPWLLHFASPSLSHFPSYPSSRRPALLFVSLSLSLFLFLSFLSSFPSSLATAPPSRGLTLFSVNANGFHDVMKTNVIKHYISSTLPQVCPLHYPHPLSHKNGESLLPSDVTCTSNASRSRILSLDELSLLMSPSQLSQPAVSLYVSSLPMPRGTLVAHSQLYSNSGVCWVPSAATHRFTRGVS